MVTVKYACLLLRMSALCPVRSILTKIFCSKYVEISAIPSKTEATFSLNQPRMHPLDHP